MENNNNLFDSFPSVSAKEWKQLIQMDLKGADYNDTLVWQSLEGINVKPFYHPDEYEYIDIPIPEEAFRIRQKIFIDDVAIANKLAIDALEKGADALLFEATKSFDMDVLLQNFSPFEKKITLFFNLHFLSESFSSDLLHFFRKTPVFLSYDPLGHLTQTGNWYNTANDDFNFLKKLTTNHPKTKLILICADLFHNAGANTVQQVSYALSMAQEYIRHLGKSALSNIHFSFAVGSNYFFEMAKIRAFRYLWKKMNEEYGTDYPAVISVTPGLRNKTIYDYNVNMLRTGTEYMSAIFGGADFINTLAYDAVFKKSNAFSSRIARNQLLIMREENGLNQAIDYAKGSYYIEALTLEIAKRSLDILKQIERSGGYYELLKKGTIQQKIQAAAQKEQKLFDAGKIHLLGTNKYPNPSDRMQDAIEVFPFLKKQTNQTHIQPVITKRLAEKIEQERLQKE